MVRAAARRAQQALTVAVCTIGAALHAQPALAALTITKTTWNVIGLDSNDVNSGPNVYPVAAVVCNTGPGVATNLTTNFVWDSSNGLVNLNGPASVNRGALDPGSCLQAYYWAVVTRSPAAYGTTRRYHITATADGGLTTSTPVRELYVELFISQNRNTSQTPSGPTTVVVGQTYTYNWVGGTATQGYEQIENLIAFDDGKGVAAGRAAMYMQGTVKDNYRVSLSFDSERPDRGVLFRDIQPDAFYPIYGASRNASTLNRPGGSMRRSSGTGATCSLAIS